MNDPELLIEEFDYNEAYQLTNYLYPLIIAIIVLSYVWLDLLMLFQSQNRKCGLQFYSHCFFYQRVLHR